MNKPFVGFGIAENFLKAIDPTKPVNADSILHAGKGGKYGICLVTEAIVLSQVNNDEVLYCYIPVGHFQSLDGRTELGGDRNRDRALSAWEITTKWLDDHGVKYREAMLAMPKTYQMMSGHCEFMRYDKETDSYKMVEAQS